MAESLSQIYAAERSARLDAFLAAESGISRSKVKKLIESGAVCVDGKPCVEADFRLSAGQYASLDLPEEHSALTPEQGDLRIVYQDSELAVVEKPAGLTVHPCPSCPEGTLVHLLLSHFEELKSMEGLRPGIVHRLDKDTSGLLIVALKEETRLKLSEDFAERRVHKTYLALVHGVLPETGESRLPLGRHPTIKTKMAVVPENKGGRDAYSEWKRLYADPQGRFSLAAVTIHTGRTHQIRVHMAEAGYPLLGDALYAPKNVVQMAPRQMLHAWKLDFVHPASNKPLQFLSPPPPDFLDTVRRHSQLPIRIILTGCAGCGKSAVLSLLQSRNIPVFSADACIAALYAPNADGWRLLRGNYGLRFTPEDNQPVDKKALAAAMQDDFMRREINSLLHPLVFNAIQDFFAEHTQIAAAEIPLWHEAAAQTTQKFTAKKSSAPALSFTSSAISPACPKTGKEKNTASVFAAELATERAHASAAAAPSFQVVTITCPPEQRLARLHTRGWDDELIARMDSWQWAENDKARASDFCLPNDSDLATLEKKVDSLLETLRANEQRRLDDVVATLKKITE